MHNTLPQTAAINTDSVLLLWRYSTYSTDCRYSTYTVREYYFYGRLRYQFKKWQWL